MAPHSSTLAWKIPWMEEPGRLQSMGSLKVRHDWATSLSIFTFLHWRRKWQPTPVFLPGESQGRGSLVAAIYGVTQSRTRLKWLSSSSPPWLYGARLFQYLYDLHQCFSNVNANEFLRHLTKMCIFYSVYLIFYISSIFRIFFNWSIVALQCCVNFSVHFSCSVMSDSLQPHGLQDSRLVCPSPTPRAYSDSTYMS